MIYYQYHLGGTALQFLGELSNDRYLYAIINMHEPLEGQYHDEMKILDFPKDYIEKQMQQEGERKLIAFDDNFPYNKRLILQVILSKKLNKVL